MIVNRKATILIVDDSAFMRGLIRFKLSRNGFRVIGEAENGKVGVEKYKTLRPDIVTLDITMDEMDGQTALEQIMEYDPNAKVVIISSIIGQKAFYVEAKEKGAKAILVKPIAERVLVETLINLLR